jgi:DNA-binding response OmpR family regulator
LTPTEFQLLSALISHAGRVVTRKFLLQAIWDQGGMFIEDNTLSVHISRLREKIGSSRIRTVRGVGYRWADEENS